MPNGSLQSPGLFGPTPETSPALPFNFSPDTRTARRALPSSCFCCHRGAYLPSPLCLPAPRGGPARAQAPFGAPRPPCGQPQRRLTDSLGRWQEARKPPGHRGDPFSNPLDRLAGQRRRPRSDTALFTRRPPAALSELSAPFGVSAHRAPSPRPTSFSPWRQLRAPLRPSSPALRGPPFRVTRQLRASTAGGCRGPRGSFLTSRRKERARAKPHAPLPHGKGRQKAASSLPAP